MISRGPIVSTDYEVDWSHFSKASVQPEECPDASVLREKNVLRTRDAACYLGLSQWKVRELVRAGRLRVLSGKYWRFRLEDLDEFLQGGLL